MIDHVKVLCLLLLVGICSPAAAQVFNRRYDLVGSVGNSGTAWSVELLSDSSYLLICNGSYADDTTLFGSVVRVLMISSVGEITSEERIIDSLRSTYPGWSNCTAKNLDGGFVIGGSNFRVDSLDNWISRPVLFFISSAGTIDSSKALAPDDQSWIGRSANQTPDGGFVICGETSAQGNGLQAFVIRTDAQGNELWTQVYGGPWSEYALSVVHAPSDLIYTGGAKFISASNSQFWVQCLTAEGAVLWEKVWGGAFEEPSAAISLAANGDILVAGSHPVSEGYLARRYLARLTPVDGSFIWQNRYGLPYVDCALQTVKEISPSMDLIACGSMSESGFYSGTLLRTTSDGDSLWMRQYVYQDTVVSNGRGILRDVVPTPDGGFIAVGSALSVPGVYSQDVWAFKVDSMGCLEPGCHLITGMETQVTNLRGALSIAPNPVAQGGTVHVQLSLPENFTPQGSLHLTVISSDGRVVQEHALSAGAVPYSLSLDVSGVRPGLYHLHLSDATRWITGAKLIVE